MGFNSGFKGLKYIIKFITLEKRKEYNPINYSLITLVSTK